MRTHLSMLLAIMLSLNASYVASAGICGALEQSASHAAHFGHHSHEHSEDHAHDEHAQDDHTQDSLQVSDDEAGRISTASDHHHHHVHPSFSSILPDIISVMPLAGASPLVAALPGTFNSVSHVLPDRPPRASLA